MTEHFLPFSIQSFNFTALPEGPPHFDESLSGWCMDTLGYVPEIAWGCRLGITFCSQADLTAFYIMAPSTDMHWD